MNIRLSRILIAAVCLSLCLMQVPVATAGHTAIVNDVTQLNPVTVDRVVTPYTVEELQALVRQHHGPISIGGGRYSMGGQTASEQTLHVDMRQLNRILRFDPPGKTITVEAGITWRAIQEVIDRHDLSLQIMQSYANFTVGGSLSVNVHGRYIGHGPLIGSVQSITVILANGDRIHASPTEHKEIFYGCIGGYGGIGIIVEATLSLADNQSVKRRVDYMTVQDYRDYFIQSIQSSPTVIFHNGDIYPPNYDHVAAVTWETTQEPVTVKDRLQPANPSPSWMNQLGYWWLSEVSGAQTIRRLILDPIRLSGQSVVWRNYEASYDVSELEPRSREHSTYVLEEYFVPVGRFDEFVPKMANIFTRHQANILNVSIRHAVKDPGSLMAWAREDVFAFVVYYKQGTDPESRREVGEWTRELIDAALSVNGTYYLPYQLHATDAQFHRAYPNADAYFALKEQLDPENRFRNKLLDRYYHPGTTKPLVTPDGSVISLTPATIQNMRTRDEFRRPLNQTYLTIPEWYIVYSADEIASFTQRHAPSEFPYLVSIRQFWSLYHGISSLSPNQEPINWGAHLMLSVIGASFTAEYLIKGTYESTIGAFTEWLSRDDTGQIDTPEDRFIQAISKEYAEYIHQTPWYAFRFLPKIPELWRTSGPLTHTTRRLERRLSYTAELLAKAAWGQFIEWATGASYAPEELTIHGIAILDESERTPMSESIKIIDNATSNSLAQDAKQPVCIQIPRYEGFRRAVEELLARHAQFVDIAGNQIIAVTILVPVEWHDTHNLGRTIWESQLPTNPTMKRVALLTPIPRLHLTLAALKTDDAILEHLYDF